MRDRTRGVAASCALETIHIHTVCPAKEDLVVRANVNAGIYAVLSKLGHEGASRVQHLHATHVFGANKIVAQAITRQVLRAADLKLSHTLQRLSVEHLKAKGDFSEVHVHYLAKVVFSDSNDRLSACIETDAIRRSRVFAVTNI